MLEDEYAEEEESEVDEKVKEVRENTQLMHATWKWKWILTEVSRLRSGRLSQKKKNYPTTS